MPQDPATTSDVVAAFNDAWNSHDLDAVLALVGDDCVFESARPGANGSRIVGRRALRDAWSESFAAPGGEFVFEETIVCGDRATQLWSYGEGDSAVRGVDVLKVADGQVVEKLGYVKVR